MGARRIVEVVEPRGCEPRKCIVRCPECGSRIGRFAMECPHCGAAFSKGIEWETLKGGSYEQER